jgi:hypothetical protein
MRDHGLLVGPSLSVTCRRVRSAFGERGVSRGAREDQNHSAVGYSIGTRPGVLRGHFPHRAVVLDCTLAIAVRQLAVRQLAVRQLAVVQLAVPPCRGMTRTAGTVRRRWRQYVGCSHMQVSLAGSRLGAACA